MSDDWQHHETDPGAGLPPGGFLNAHRLGEPAAARALEASRRALRERPTAGHGHGLARIALAAAAVLLVALLGLALRESGSPAPSAREAADAGRIRVMSLRVERTDAPDRPAYRLQISYSPPADPGEEAPR